MENLPNFTLSKMSDLIQRNTPVEQYEGIYVKREDLSSIADGPPFSKVRGLIPHLIKLQNQGIKTVGYTETSISMAGWGVAWGCSLLGLKAVLFDPQYKVTPPLLNYHRKQWAKFSPEIIPVPAGRAKVNFYISSKILSEKYEHSKMLPLGLVLPEAIEGTFQECRIAETYDLMNLINSIVVCVGSGTIASGILKAFPNKTLIGIMSRTGSIPKKRKLILSKSQLSDNGFFGAKDFRLLDPGWEYSDRSIIKSPFPCHPWYDLKAWQWLVENRNSIKPPILFWNIGRVK